MEFGKLHTKIGITQLFAKNEPPIEEFVSTILEKVYRINYPGNVYHNITLNSRVRLSSFHQIP